MNRENCLDLFDGWESFSRLKITGYTLRNGTDVCTIQFPSSGPSQESKDRISGLIQDKWFITAIYFEDNPPLSEPEQLSKRITQYLISGGTFNPEMALHDKVRDLLIGCRKYIDETLKNKKEEDSYSVGLLNLLADIRAAVGDPEGKLMQNELVEHCKKLKEEHGWLSHLTGTIKDFNFLNYYDLKDEALKTWKKIQ